MVTWKSSLLPIGAWGVFLVYLTALHATAGLYYRSKMPIAMEVSQSSGDEEQQTQGNSEPSPFVKEPEPQLLRHRLIVLVLASKSFDLKGHLPAAIAQFHTQYGNEFLREKIYVVGDNKMVKSWDNIAALPPVVTAFDDSQYDSAIAAGFWAADELVPAPNRAEYVCVLIWQSPVSPDNVRSLAPFMRNDSWRNRTYFVWAAHAADVGSQTLLDLFPDRLISLGRADESDPGALGAYIFNRLRKLP